MIDAEGRATAIGKLFAGFDRDPSPEQVAIYIEATARLELGHLRAGVDLLLRTRRREDGFPYPADVAAAARERRERERAQIDGVDLEKRREIEAHGRRTGRLLALGPVVRAIKLPKAEGE